eukprot:4675884-Pyramimonas_sp.AAC.1
MAPDWNIFGNILRHRVDGPGECSGGVYIAFVGADRGWATSCAREFGSESPCGSTVVLFALEWLLATAPRAMEAFVTAA